MTLPRLSPAQAEAVRSWLPDAELVADMSWPGIDTTVLHVRTPAGEVVVKAGGQGNHHIRRELTAHESATGPLLARDAAARLRHADRDANVLVFDFQPGVLVEGTEAELSPEVHRQAGALLHALHDQPERVDAEYDRAADAKALAWLAGEHRVPSADAARVRRLLTNRRAEPATLVPTHGDWQPRNWLIDGDRVRVIDFGRFAFRPAATDFVRLAAQQWRERPDLEAAFLAGYGSDPREGEMWRYAQLHEAVGTAVWAHQVGDEPFEAQGLRMLTEALARF
ncbi:phosphotransferase [Microbacterium gorillae]|uniref:phosphotransferase n=1 Tax=Microbacterium gorillae TaxID=1231063 RepID=UPI00058AE8BC|nr:phosphotransferase [Microbacterium gorillae]